MKTLLRCILSVLLYGCALETTPSATEALGEPLVAPTIAPTAELARIALAHADSSPGLELVGFVRLDYAGFESRVASPRVPQPERVVLSDRGDTVEIRTTRVGARDGGIYAWTGAIDADVYGQSFLSISREGAAGAIYLDRVSYELLPFGGGVSVVYRGDTGGLGPDDLDDHPVHRLPDFLAPRTSSDPVRVLLLYSQGVDFGVWACANAPQVLEPLRVAYEHELNELYDAVQATDHDIEVAALDCVESQFSAIVSLSSGGQVWNAVRHDTEVRAARDAADADLVVVLVEGSGGHASRPDLDALDRPIGCSKHGTDPVPPAGECAYAAVGTGSSIVHFTLAHELGHLFGMRHDRWRTLQETGPESLACNHGSFLFDGGVPFARTLMAYDELCNMFGRSCARIGAFSQPNDYYVPLVGDRPLGVACGTSDDPHHGDADNRAVFVHAAPVVAAYR